MDNLTTNDRFNILCIVVLGSGLYDFLGWLGNL